MKSPIKIKYQKVPTGDLIILMAYEGKGQLDLKSWPKDIANFYQKLQPAKKFHAEQGKTFSFHMPQGPSVLVLGLGKKGLTNEEIRKAVAKAYNNVKASEFDKDAALWIEGIFSKDAQYVALCESLLLSSYTYEKYKSKKIARFNLTIQMSKTNKTLQKAFEKATIVTDGVCFTRDLVNEVPNVLNSETFAKIVQDDCKKNLKGVKVKILNREQITKENMNLLLAVNKGSHFEPRVVHLTYTPSRATKKTPHLALVGKGLTFDSGGYSLKGNMVGMKMDMGGAATVYGAFRNAVLLKSPYKISCFLGMTDNMVSSEAITPDAVVTGRSGTTVEILNTDAEGRLVLADVMSYASDTKPDLMIDAATLTGACMRALDFVCGVMSNNDRLAQALVKRGLDEGEKLWQLPIFPEFRDDIKSKIADIKNLSNSPNAGAQKAGAFLENFVGEGIPWAHMDIAGLAEGVKTIPYCPTHGGTGLMVKTLTHFLTHDKLPV